MPKSSVRKGLFEIRSIFIGHPFPHYLPRLLSPIHVMSSGCYYTHKTYVCTVLHLNVLRSICYFVSYSHTEYVAWRKHFASAQRKHLRVKLLLVYVHEKKHSHQTSISISCHNHATSVVKQAALQASYFVL